MLRFLERTLEPFLPPHRRTFAGLSTAQALCAALLLAACGFLDDGPAGVSTGPGREDPVPDEGAQTDEDASDDRADGDGASDEGGAGEGSAADNLAGDGDGGGDGMADMEAGGAGMDGAAGGSDSTSSSPGNPETGRLAGITAVHNDVRRQLSEEGIAEPALPELTWSPEIADYAQQWADTLAADCGTLEHRSQSMYGENLALFSSWPVPPDTAPEDVVWGWASEAQCYELGPFLEGDVCDFGCAAALNANGCGHYTQVVWRDTREVGCGIAECTLGRELVDVWVCNYDPPGNFVGALAY